ncbi:hypothetical protein [Paenibacillus sp. Marseille-Q7038]
MRSEGSHYICLRQTGGLPGGATREADELIAKLRIPVFTAGKQGDSAEQRAQRRGTCEAREATAFA